MSDFDLIVLNTAEGRVVKTRAELEALANIGILPSHIGYEDESKLVYLEDHDSMDLEIEY